MNSTLKICRHNPGRHRQNRKAYHLKYESFCPTKRVHLCSQISYETLDTFFKNGKVKTLLGLHAKIYVADNSVLVTSSNLTKAAYTQRYEMGVYLEGKDAADAINQFGVWWDKKSKEISIEQLQELKNKCASGSTEPQEKKGLPILFSLPQEPARYESKSGQGNLGGFDYFVKCYDTLAQKYSAIQRLEPTMPLYLEVDGLLDYLFHHGDKLSNMYGRDGNSEVIPPRNVTTLDTDIAQCAKLYKQWIKDEDEDITWRLKRSSTIQRLLSPKQIFNLNKDGLKDVADCLNCMNSYEINKARFLNTDNNKLADVKKHLNNLLHDKEDYLIRMRNCRDGLKYFGDSSVQELMGFYFPKEYPIRNGNSNAGLRYFGFDVSI